MAIKISGTTVIDDSRNAVNLISANVSTTFNTSTANVSTVVTGNTLTLSTGTGSNSNVVISANGSEYIRVTNVGRVGISTTNPTSNLHVVGNANITLGINTSTLNATTVNAATILNAVGANLSNAVLKTGDTMTGSLNFNFSGSNVSIQQQNDLAVIEMGGANGAFIDMKSPNSDDFDFRIITIQGSTSFVSNNAAQVVAFSGANVNFDSGTLFVDSVGNEIGIGITDPTSNLHVVGNANITLGINTSTLNATTVNTTTLLATTANITIANVTNLFASGATINGKLNVNNDLNVTGNIYLNGNTTYINVSTYTVDDPLIYLAANNNLTDTVDMGFMGGKNTSGTYSHTGLVRDATDAKWKLFDGLPEEGHIGNIINFNNTYLATLVANVEANTLTVINGVSGNVNFDSGTLFVDSVANEVGIGTTNPTSNLHVVGNANITTGIVTSTINASTINATTIVNATGANLSNAVLKTGDTMTGSLAISGARLSVSNTTDNVVTQSILLIGNRNYGAGDNGGTQLIATGSSGTLGTHDYGAIKFYARGFSGTADGGGAIVSMHVGGSSSNATSNGMFLQVDGALNSPQNIKFYTGTSGTERIRIDANGNVCIGTTSTTRKLDLFNSGTTTTDLIVRNGTVTYSTFVDSGAGYTGTTTNHPLLFFTNNTEKMRILADGNVAIGTTSSAYKLYVNDTAATGAGLYVTGGGQGGPIARFERTVGATGSFVEINSSGNNPQIRYSRSGFNTVYWSIGVNGNNELKISNSDVDTNDRITIANTGNVGIGTTTADQRLVVNGAIQAATTGNNGDLYLGGPNVSIRSTYSSNVMGLYTNNSERMRIVANGDVSIGTSVPVGRLHVQSSNDGTFLRLQRTGGSNIPILNINLTESTNLIEYEATGSVAPSFAWKLGGSERVRIDANGNVSIGSTTSSDPLKIYRAGQGQTGLVLNSDAGTSLALIANRTSGGSSPLTQAGDATLIFHAGSANTGNLVIAQWSTLSRGIRIDSSGNVAIGTTSPTSNLHVIGTANITSNLVVGGAITENTNGTFYNVATQFDIGTAPNQIPLNQYLGTMAFQDAAGIAVGEMSVSGNTNFDSGTLFVDTINNRIGISTITPTANLHVHGSSILGGITGSGRRIDVDSSGRAVFIYNDNALVNQITLDNLDTTANTDHGSQILWRLATNASSTAINAGRISVAKQQVWTSTTSTQDAYMAFSTISDGNLSERMRITDVGNVGIGITGPTKKLHVLGSAIISDGSTPANNATLLVQDDGVANTVTSGATFRVANDGSGATFAVFEASSGVSNTVITNAGNMGIGTTSPLGRLHVSGGDTILDNNRGLRWRDSSGNANNNFLLQSDNNFVYYNGNNRAIWSATETLSPVAAFGAGTGIRTTWDASGNTIVFTTSATERMRITSTGNVAIGTSTPSYLFSVFGNANNGSTVVQQINNANTESAALAVLQLNSGAGTRYVNLQVHGANQYYQESQSNITTKYSDFNVQIFRNGSGTERMRIDANGNVSIGTTSTTYKLEVNGSFAATTKSFVINHPTKPGKKLRYGSLEGPENGVYVRGKVNGNVIELPDYWVGLVDEESITVNLTPIGKHQKLFVKYIEGNKVYISNDSMFSSDINCYYTVFAERKDVDKLQVEY